MTVDAYDRRLDSYFVREGIKRKSKKADLEKIKREECTFE